MGRIFLYLKWFGFRSYKLDIPKVSYFVGFVLHLKWEIHCSDVRWHLFTPGEVDLLTEHDGTQVCVAGRARSPC